MAANDTDKKRILYEHAAAELARCWQEDAVWCETGDTRWAQARTLDDQLVTGRTDAGVTLKAYRALCLRLIALYVGAAHA